MSVTLTHLVWKLIDRLIELRVNVSRNRFDTFCLNVEGIEFLTIEQGCLQLLKKLKELHEIYDFDEEIISSFMRTVSGSIFEVSEEIADEYNDLDLFSKRHKETGAGNEHFLYGKKFGENQFVKCCDEIIILFNLSKDNIMQEVRERYTLVEN